MKVLIGYEIITVSKMSGLMRSLSTSTLVLMICCCVLICAGASLNGRCKIKRHTHKAMQTDLNGRRCWDDVKILGCGGYCLSYEVGT